MQNARIMQAPKISRVHSFKSSGFALHISGFFFITSSDIFAQHVIHLLAIIELLSGYHSEILSSQRYALPSSRKSTPQMPDS